jgi:hypothetical protein
MTTVGHPAALRLSRSTFSGRLLPILEQLGEVRRFNRVRAVPGRPTEQRFEYGAAILFGRSILFDQEEVGIEHGHSLTRVVHQQKRSGVVAHQQPQKPNDKTERSGEQHQTSQCANCRSNRTAPGNRDHCRLHRLDEFNDFGSEVKSGSWNAGQYSNENECRDIERDRRRLCYVAPKLARLVQPQPLFKSMVESYLLRLDVRNSVYKGGAEFRVFLITDLQGINLLCCCLDSFLTLSKVCVELANPSLYRRKLLRNGPDAPLSSGINLQPRYSESGRGPKCANLIHVERAQSKFPSAQVSSNNCCDKLDRKSRISHSVMLCLLHQGTKCFKFLCGHHREIVRVANVMYVSCTEGAVSALFSDRCRVRDKEAFQACRHFGHVSDKRLGSGQDLLMQAPLLRYGSFSSFPRMRSRENRWLRVNYSKNFTNLSVGQKLAVLVVPVQNSIGRHSISPLRTPLADNTCVQSSNTGWAAI